MSLFPRGGALHLNIRMDQRHRVFPIVVQYPEIQIGVEMTCTARLRSPGDVGLAIQQARLARGMSQSELAAELGITQSAVSEIEGGKSTIYLRRVLALARATGLELSASWESDDAPRG